MSLTHRRRPCAFVSALPIAPARPQPFLAASAGIASPRQAPRWTMGRVAKFGPFTPLVLLTRLVIGDRRLNKIRGKAIALHSQAITAFCTFAGTGPKMRQRLIRKAKENGDALGFLS